MRVDSEDGLESGWVEKCMTLAWWLSTRRWVTDRDKSDSWNARVTESQSESLLLVPVSLMNHFATETSAREYLSSSYWTDGENPKTILFFE